MRTRQVGIGFNGDFQNDRQVEVHLIEELQGAMAKPSRQDQDKGELD